MDIDDLLQELNIDPDMPAAASQEHGTEVDNLLQELNIDIRIPLIYY